MRMCRQSRLVAALWLAVAGAFMPTSRSHAQPMPEPAQPETSPPAASTAGPAGAPALQPAVALEEAETPGLFDAALGIPGEGPLSAVVPSVLDDAILALARFGTRSFCEVSAPARELAEGFPIDERVSRRIEAEAGALRRWPSSERV